MAAALLPVASQALAPVADAAKAQVEKIKADPILWVSGFLIKAGSIVFLLGLGAYFLAGASRRAAQGFIGDIDNTLGIKQESPPTPPRKVVPVPAPPPPPPPPVQATTFNKVVADINSLGTVSASGNVALLQDALNQLWSIAGIAYGIQGGKPTQSVGPNLGPDLCKSIMQTCLIIYQLEGRNVSDPSFQWQTWNSAQLYTGGGSNRFLSGITSVALGAFVQENPADWTDAIYELSSTDNNNNFKNTLNDLAQDLNLSQPFDLSHPTSNSWGVLGVVVSDLSAIGTEIVQGAETVGSDVENALITFGKDAAGVFSDLGTAFAFIGKAIINAPRLIFDSLGYGFSWGGEMVLDAIYTSMLIAGAVMVVAGSALGFFWVNIWPKAESRVMLAANAGVARLWNHIDARFGTKAKIKEVRQQAAIEAQVESTNAMVAPEVVKQPIVSIPPIPVSEGEEVVAVDIAPPAPEEAPGPTVETPPVPPPPPDVSEPVPTLPEPSTAVPEVGQPADKQGNVPGGATTEETEAFLGENRTRAPTPDELKVQETNRIGSMPEPGPSYRQRKEEAEHERADRLLKMGEEWGEA